MEIWQIVLIIVGAILLVSISVFLICGNIFYHFVFNRRKDDKNFAKNESPDAKNHPDRLWYFANKIEELSIRSFDNLSLKGYFISNNSNKLAIICHGYRGRYYSSVSQARIFFEDGYDVLMPNNRGHDSSEGKQFSMGPKETKDLLMWIDLMIKRNPNYEIVLMGISMGAHIVMMSIGEILPNNVKCFIEDCGYTNMKDELKVEMERLLNFKNANFIIWLNNIYIKIFHRFSINNSTLTSLSKAKIPGLFMHGDKDDFVPFTDLDKNYSIMPKGIDRKKVVFENAGHNQSIQDFEKYKKEVINFVNRYIK